MTTRDRYATTALVLGLLSLPFGICAPLAIWVGIRSLRRIERSDRNLSGRSAALMGVVTGIIGAAFAMIGIAYWWLSS